MQYLDDYFPIHFLRRVEILLGFVSSYHHGAFKTNFYISVIERLKQTGKMKLNQKSKKYGDVICMKKGVSSVDEKVAEKWH